MIISVERRGGLKARGANVDRDRASSRIVAKPEAAKKALPGPRSEWRDLVFSGCLFRVAPPCSDQMRSPLPGEF
jgi:hypothetical protein